MNQNIWKGILAGAIAGLAGTAIKLVWENVMPTRPANVDSPTVELADRVKEETAGEALTAEEAPVVDQAVSWLFGTGIGALYGGLVELYPDMPTGKGSVLGMAYYGATHGSVLPMLNAEPWPLHKPMKFVSSEFSGNVVYGLTVEVTRRMARKWLDERDAGLLPS
ncbi:MAG: DUF1440 domain-containing protein [Bacteroidetes bacterium]|nr:DUF1440 domain-containing protein [Bacteroidota bacterium]